MIKTLVFALLVASAFSIKLAKKGDGSNESEEGDVLTHAQFKDNLASAKVEFLKLSHEMKQVSNEAKYANDQAALGNWTAWEELDNEMRADLEGHRDTFEEEEEKMLSMAEQLYEGHSDFPDSERCGALYFVIQAHLDSGDDMSEELGKSVLRALEHDIACFSEVAKEAEHIPEFQAGMEAEHAFGITVEVMKRLFVIRHSAGRFEEAALAAEDIFNDEEESADKRKLMALLRRALKTL